MLQARPVGVVDILPDHALGIEKRPIERYGSAHDGDEALAVVIETGQDLLGQLRIQPSRMAGI
jgi:hypothetical protein